MIEKKAKKEVVKSAGKKEEVRTLKDMGVILYSESPEPVKPVAQNPICHTCAKPAPISEMKHLGFVLLCNKCYANMRSSCANNDDCECCGS